MSARSDKPGDRPTFIVGRDGRPIRISVEAADKEVEIMEWFRRLLRDQAAIIASCRTAKIADETDYESACDLLLGRRPDERRKWWQVFAAVIRRILRLE